MEPPPMKPLTKYMLRTWTPPPGTESIKQPLPT